MYISINIQRTGLVLQESVAATDNTRVNAGHQPGGRQHAQLADIANAPLVELLMATGRNGGGATITSNYM